MRTTPGIRGGSLWGLVAVTVCVLAVPILAQQPHAAAHPNAKDVKGFREFSAHVRDYMSLRKKVESRLPTLRSTDLPEVTAGYQQAFARKLREARPKAKVGDVFTSNAREAFRRASLAALGGPDRANARADMRADAPNSNMLLEVNGVYDEAETIAAISPILLAAYPELSDEVTYRVVGRTLVLVDLKSRMIVDLARFTLPAEP